MTDIFENYLSSTGALSAEEINFSMQFFKPIRLKKGDFFIRDRKIFYDTDGIMERQREELKDCDHCRGLRLIKTSSDLILTCLGVELPIDCCPACEREGYEAFNRVKDDFLIVQLLDQKNKQFRYRPRA